MLSDKHMPLHPGGLKLTNYSVQLCEFPPGAKLLDIGCGTGSTVDFLRNAGFEAFGVDCDPSAIAAAGAYCHIGDACELPFKTESLDGVLFECVLSHILFADKALSEASRVLADDGKLIVSDLYARNEKYKGTLQNLTRWLELINRSGFSCLTFEDRNEDLKEYAAQMLWNEGCLDIGGFCDYDIKEMEAAHCGYFFLTATL